MDALARAAPWPAPAKLNRLLRIIGRREDGYHLLQTVFQFVDRCDFLWFSVRRDGVICRRGEVIGVTAENDLTIRAAQLLASHCAVRLGINIYIEKRLPLGGGLGGGSSDAATALVALNHYWGTALSLSELAALGAQLGADVPVFVHGQAAWAEGVGERLTALTQLDEPWFIVITPPLMINTREVFDDPDLTRHSEPITMRASIDALSVTNTTTEVIHAGHSIVCNDCESVVFRRYPLVATAARWLEQFATAHLTGTGSSLFAALSSRAQAEQVLAQLPQGWFGFVSRGRNRSPLQERLQRAKIS